MSFIALLKAIAAKHLAPGAPKPVRTKTPLRLAQDSAVTISITPMILAEDAGALFKSDLPTDHKIIAVGRYSLFGLDVYHVYLSQSEGAFIHFAIKGNDIIETQLYRQYDELYPVTSGKSDGPDDWMFWLAEADGNIGMPIMESKGSDGFIAYRRTLTGDQRLDPLIVTETLVDATGYTMTMRHRLMHYSRALTDPKLTEHLLASVVETEAGASVDRWLGIDLATTDLTVFAAADTPL
jgi:hypothetical protein